MTERAMPQHWQLFPVRRSQFAEQIEEHTVDWLERYQLAPNPHVQARLRRSHIGRTVAHSHPDGSLSILELTADVLQWMLSFDDTYVDVSSPVPSTIASHIADFIGIFDGRMYRRDETGHRAALADLVARAHELLSTEQAERLTAAIRMTLFGQLWQATTTGNPIGLREYKTMRRYTSLATPMIALIEPAAGITLSAATHANPDVRRLTEAAQDLPGWVNDLYSFSYEYDTADMIPRTLPALIAQENRCSISEAFEVAARLCDEEAQLAHALSLKLEQTGLSDLATYAQAVRDSIGAHAWWNDTERYKISTDQEDAESRERK